MSLFGEPLETSLSALLRYLGYFALGALLGTILALFSMTVIDSERSSWHVPVSIILCSGTVGCVLGAFSRGRILSALLRLLGRHVD